MNYSAHYDRLIQRARSRALEGYIERHHVIPRCMGGTDDAYNIVRLTAREHFVAHQLLVKIYPDVGGLIAAVRYLTSTRQGNPVKSRMYEWLRKKHSAQMSLNNKGKKMTIEQIAKAAASHVGKKRSDESKARMSNAAKLRKISDIGRQALKDAKAREKLERIQKDIPHFNTGISQSEQHKQAIRNGMLGKKQTPEQIAKRVASRKATLAKKAEKDLSWT